MSITLRRFAPRARWPLALLALALGLCLSSEAHAVRPFVTDDARISAKGQIEVESWLEMALERGALPGTNLQLNFEILEWLELGVAGELAFEEGAASVGRPALQAKLLFWRPVEARLPGAALVFGASLPYRAGGPDEEGSFLYAIAPFTYTFSGGHELHLNLGWLGAALPGQTLEQRFFWGVGGELGLGESDFSVIGEVFAGDPADPLVSELGFQGGLRWVASEYLNVDLAAGADSPAGGSGLDWNMQLGLRFLLDAWTRGTPDPEGGKGLFRRPG